MAKSRKPSLETCSQQLQEPHEPVKLSPLQLLPEEHDKLMASANLWESQKRSELVRWSATNATSNKETASGALLKAA